MKKYTQQEIDQIPNILKCYWYESWIKEQSKPMSYLGKLAILVRDKKNTKSNKAIFSSHWITEGIDFEIVK